MKTKLKRIANMKGCHQTELLSVEFMWRERHGDDSARLIFNNIIRDIAAQYPLP